MRGFSLWQPWASLIALGAKQIETRSWRTDYTGPLAIAATHRVPTAAREDIEQFIRLYPIGRILGPFGYTSLSTMPHGVIVARCNLVRCEPTTSEWVQAALKRRSFEFTLGDYSPGRWAWILSDIEPIEHIPNRTGFARGVYPLDTQTALKVSRAPIWKQ